MISLRGGDLGSVGWPFLGKGYVFWRFTNYTVELVVYFAAFWNHPWLSFQKKFLAFVRYGRWKNLQGVIETSMDWGPLCAEFMPACSKGCREWSQLLDVTFASDITLFQRMPILVGIQHAYIHFKTIFCHESKYLPGYSPNERKTKQGLSWLSPHPGCEFKATSTPPLLNLIDLSTRSEWINCVGIFFLPVSLIFKKNNDVFENPVRLD